jgi:hypothetical protein
MGIIRWFLHTRWEKKYEKIFKKAKNHSLAYLRRSYDLHRAIILSLVIAMMLNILDVLRDLINGNPSYKIGLIFEFIMALAFIIYFNKSIDSESALEVREKQKHKSKKEALKIIARPDIS